MSAPHSASVPGPPPTGSAPGECECDPDAIESTLLSEQAFARAAGAPLLRDNSVEVLRDATENYPAWLAAIAAAKSWVHFETYILADDAAGRLFLDALTERAKAGVRVRLLYDWLGTLRTSGSRLWRPLIKAGGEVRCFNPPRADSPLGWLSRDHRKMVAVDGQIGFVSGLCVSRKWQGDPGRGLSPWRDTGVVVHGPAVAEIEAAFAQVWAAAGSPLPAGELPDAAAIPAAGTCAMRVIHTAPTTAGLYRLDLVVAAVARRTLWLTDAYYVGMAPYVQALRAAAADGVDVRLLVPGASDLKFLKPFTRAGYRPLLEAGVRVFEWNGPMLHAKSAVADGRWSRVGSTNLNLSSWIGNYELDVFVENEEFASEMAAMYEADLGCATEIVLRRRRRRLRPTPAEPPQRQVIKDRRGIPGRAAAGALRFANTVGAAVGNRRVLDPAEARLMAGAGAVLLVLTLLCALWPRLVAIPLAAGGAWLTIAVFIKAWRLYRKGRAAVAAEPPGALRSLRPPGASPPGGGISGDSHVPAPTADGGVPEEDPEESAEEPSSTTYESPTQPQPGNRP